MTQLNSSRIQPTHHETILDQFTRQCEEYSTVPEITKAETLDLLVALSGAGPQETVLDVACGPGHVACAFAQVVREATRNDRTPAMIEQTRALQRKQDLRNVNWHAGDVLFKKRQSKS